MRPFRPRARFCVSRSFASTRREMGRSRRRVFIGDGARRMCLGFLRRWLPRRRSRLRRLLERLPLLHLHRRKTPCESTQRRSSAGFTRGERSATYATFGESFRKAIPLEQVDAITQGIEAQQGKARRCARRRRRRTGGGHADDERGRVLRARREHLFDFARSRRHPSAVCASSPSRRRAPRAARAQPTTTLPSTFYALPLRGKWIGGQWAGATRATTATWGTRSSGTRSTFSAWAPMGRRSAPKERPWPTTTHSTSPWLHRPMASSCA